MSEFSILDLFTVVQQKPELACDRCGTVISVIQDSSSLTDLIQLADQHLKESHARA